MPLYTVRVRIRMLQSESRGGDYAEMVHHFEWPDDATAIDDFGTVVEEVSSGAMAKCWVAVRGGGLTNQCTLYRRNIDDPKQWHRLYNHSFGLPEYIGVDINVEGLPLVGVEAPLWPDSRGAVLVRCRGINPGFERRVYVGPMSPCVLMFQGGFADAPVFGDLLTIASQATNPNTGDFPLDFHEDTIDVWRLKQAEIARDHVANIAGNFELGGIPVVPSWKLGTWSTLGQVDASLVRAVIKSRGQRAAMTDAVTASFTL